MPTRKKKKRSKVPKKKQLRKFDKNAASKVVLESDEYDDSDASYKVIKQKRKRSIRFVVCSWKGSPSQERIQGMYLTQNAL